MKIQICSSLLPILFSGLLGMPQDSNTYFYTTSAPSKTVCAYSPYLDVPASGLTSSALSSYQLTLHSEPSPGIINVDTYNKAGSTGLRDGAIVSPDRGGDAYLLTMGANIRISTNPGCFPHTVYVGFFQQPNIFNSPGDRWLKLSYIYQGTLPTKSVSTVSQPFAIKSRTIPIGHESVADGGGRNRGRVPIPLGEFGPGFLIRGVVGFRMIAISDPTGGKPFNTYAAKYDLQGQGAGLNGLSGYFSEAENAYIVSPGVTNTFDVSNTINRGYIQAQYIAAQCRDPSYPYPPLGDGTGGYLGQNVGGRTVQSYSYMSPFSLNPTYSGCHATRSGIHVIENTGDDIWGTSDNFRYVYKSGSLNKILRVRVDQLENTGPWARAGLMIRSGTLANDYNVALFVTPSNGLIFQRRLSSTAGNTSSSGTVSGIKAPIWLELSYQNGVTTARYRTDTGSWISIGVGVAGTFGNYTYGLAAASRSSVPNTSVFSNLNF